MEDISEEKQRCKVFKKLNQHRGIQSSNIRLIKYPKGGGEKGTEAIFKRIALKNFSEVIF